MLLRPPKNRVIDGRDYSHWWRHIITNAMTWTVSNCTAFNIICQIFYKLLKLMSLQGSPLEMRSLYRRLYPMPIRVADLPTKEKAISSPGLSGSADSMQYHISFQHQSKQIKYTFEAFLLP